MHVSLVGHSLKREFFIDNLLVRIHFIIVMIRWTGLAPWAFEFPFPGSLTSTVFKKCLLHAEDEEWVESGATQLYAWFACGLRNLQWFRGGLVFEAHRLLYHSV